MTTLKKIVKNKHFFVFVIIQVLLCIGCFVMVKLAYTPVNQSQTHCVRLYSPSVTLESNSGYRSYNEKYIKICSDEYEFMYSSHANSKLRADTDESLLEQLQMEDYLDITYVINNSREIVEIHGENHVYYTIDDYNSFYTTNLVVAILIAAVFEVIYIVAFGIWVWDDVLGKFNPESTHLRKKHPVEKHIYDDEENEFSPYKQKLIEEEREK